MKIRIKEILQKEIEYHKGEINKHREIAIKTNSKKQRAKQIKHTHKIFQTIKIARLMGFTYCGECRRLR